MQELAQRTGAAAATIDPITLEVIRHETEYRDAQVKAALPRQHTLPDSSSLHEYLAAGGTVSYGTVCGLRLCKNVCNSLQLSNGGFGF